MEVYLRELKESDKDEVLRMVEEIKNDDTVEDKFEGLSNFKDVTGESYDDFLEKVLIINKNIKLYKPNLVNQTTYVLVDENDHIYGGANLRHELNENLLNHGGHIGYLIRPTERCKGYAKQQLLLLLEECKKYKIEKALVTCREDNIGSRKTIEACGGVYEDSREDAGKMYRRYWIDVV